MKYLWFLPIGLVVGVCIAAAVHKDGWGVLVALVVLAGALICAGKGIITLTKPLDDYEDDEDL